VVRDYQRDYAHRYLEAGALAVVGSHPHVLQPWEKYTTRNKREGVIFYSLGNFVAAQEGADRQTGAFFYLGLTKAKGEKARVFNGAYAPIYRQQLSIIPFTDTGVNLNEFYGARMRVGILDQLKKKMCSQN
jgi:poly-gamma-glutamate synthesis protein (capsule biosynthesis protein)